MWAAHNLFILFVINADNDDENKIDVPTQPIYNIGGCIARAGSWSMGFKPKPSKGTGKTLEKGLDVKIINEIKPDIIIC